MTTEQEWHDMPTLQDVAGAQAGKWEIEIAAVQGGWEPWCGDAWTEAWNFRARPRQPKTKTITLRKALMRAFDDVYVSEGSSNFDKASGFVCWLGEPYTVEVPV